MNRVSRPAATKWRTIIQEHEASGLPVARFCRTRGVPMSSFFAWRRRLRHAGIARSSPAFVEVKTHGSHRAVQDATAAEPTSPLELLLPGGHRLLLRSGFDPQVLLDLLRTLENLP